MNRCAIAIANASNPTWRPAHRLECEARLLLSMPLERRRMELKVPARQGRRAELEREMRRLWEARTA